MLRTLIGATLTAGIVSAHAATFTVTNLNDSGAGSLREAVVAANAAAGADTIDFAVTGTIVLTSGALQIEQALTIIGPGSGRLTIDGNSSTRVFVVIEAGTLPECPATTGPADYQVTISGLTLRNGRRSVANSSGGAIFSAKSLALDDVTVRASTAKNGGGLAFLVQHPGQSLTIANSRFIDNVAQEVVAGNTGNINGGAVHVSEYCGSARTMPVTVSISGSRFSGNASRPTTLGGRGGGLATFSDADITITGTRFVGNAVVSPAAPAANTSFIGGGIYGRARSLTIERSEIASNSADLGSALGAYNDLEDLQTPAEAMSVKLVNTTVAGNRALSSVTLYGFGNVAFDLANSTIAGNDAAPTRTGGVGFNTGATVPASAANALPPSLKLASTILWNPGQSGDLLDIAKNNTNIPGALDVDATQSLVGTICGAACGTINLVGSGNKIGENPLLEPLAFNGGPTRTRALGAGSPALNAGSNPLSLANDQRGAGFARVVGAATDMGAYESGNAIPPPATFTVTNLNDAGDGSLRAAVLQANFTPGPQTVTFTPGLTGTINLTSGQISINDAITIQGPGADKVTVDGGLLNRVFSAFEDVTDTCTMPSEDFPVSISGLTLTRGQRNVQNNPGGAVYSEKSLTLDSVVITSSVAARGGGLGVQTRYPGQSLTVRNSSFIDNVAKPIAGANVGTNGGGMLVRERCGTVTPGVMVDIADSLFQGNRTEPTDFSSAGAGIFADTRSTLTITDSRIVGNTIVAQNPSVPTQNNRGGGVSVESAVAVLIEGSEIAGNGAERASGLRLIVQDPALQTPSTAMNARIVNSTIAGNVGTAPLRSGAVGVYGNVALAIDNTTVAGNTSTADSPGGIVVDAGVTSPASASNTAFPTLALRSSIVAGTLVGTTDIGVYDETVVTAFTVNATNSLIGAVEPIVTVSGSPNLLGVNPLLGPLAFNGGPTRTRALQAGSPAINAGSNPLGLTTDQRGTGFARVVGAAADMGAYEFSGAATAPAVQSRVSRKVHGAAGTFDLALASTPTTPTTEPRSGGAGGNHTIVFVFDKDVTAGNASVTAGPGTAGTPTFSGNEMRVPLSGVTNQQYVTVAVSDVVAADGGTGGAGSVRVGFLLGDVNQNRVVTVSDLALVNAQIAQVVTASNYLRDVNVSGTLTVSDKGIANTQITKALPTP